MHRVVGTIVILVVMVSVFAAVPVVGHAPAPSGSAAGGDASASGRFAVTNGPAVTGSDIAPGARLMGVVRVHETEIAGEVNTRAFRFSIAHAASMNARADVVKMQVRALEDRLHELESRKQELDAARERGNISEARYRAEIADVAARSRVIQRLSAQSEAVAVGLPRAVLAERGVRVSAIRELEQRSREVSGPKVASIARSIAGGRVGASVNATRPPGVSSDHGVDSIAGSDSVENRSRLTGTGLHGVSGV